MLFFDFTSGPDLARTDMFTRFFLENRSLQAVRFFHFLVHAVHYVGKPAAARFEESHPEFRETHEDALENHVRELNQNRERMLQCMDVKKLVEKIEAHAPARRAVNGQRHIEPLCRLINRIEVRMTVTFV